MPQKEIVDRRTRSVALNLKLERDHQSCNTNSTQNAFQLKCIKHENEYHNKIEVPRYVE
jgi:hypothetical protein